MAEMTITVRIEDLPEFKARLARIKKIMRRRAWVNGHSERESEEKHMEKSVTPLNGIVEPDFLEYLDKTFKRWQQLADRGVTLGSREIAKLTDTVYGAKLNARYGFEAVARRELDEEGQDRFTLMIYKNREAVENDPPLYHFTTPIHR